MTLSSSLHSPSADATDHMFYAVNVCNCFSSLSIENSPVMESNDEKIPTANLHWKVMESPVSSLVREAITTPTIVDSNVPDNGAAVELSLAEQDQFPPSDNSYGVDTVDCPVALSSSLDSLSTNSTVCNTDVCNHFSSLPIENILVMESNVDKIPVDRIVVESSVSNLAGEAVTTPTNMDSDSPVNGAAIELSLAQLPPTCVRNLSRPAVVSDVVLASFGKWE